MQRITASLTRLQTFRTARRLGEEEDGLLALGVRIAVPALDGGWQRQGDPAGFPGSSLWGRYHSADWRLAWWTTSVFPAEEVVETRAVKDVGAGQGADGAVGLYVFLLAEMADGLAGPLFFEVAVLRARRWAAGRRDGGYVGGGSCWGGVGWCGGFCWLRGSTGCCFGLRTSIVDIGSRYRGFICTGFRLLTVVLAAFLGNRM